MQICINLPSLGTCHLKIKQPTIVQYRRSETKHRNRNKREIHQIIEHRYNISCVNRYATMSGDKQFEITKKQQNLVYISESFFLFCFRWRRNWRYFWAGAVVFFILVIPRWLPFEWLMTIHRPGRQGEQTWKDKSSTQNVDCLRKLLAEVTPNKSNDSK